MCVLIIHRICINDLFINNQKSKNPTFLSKGLYCVMFWAVLNRYTVLAERIVQ